MTAVSAQPIPAIDLFVDDRPNDGPAIELFGVEFDSLTFEAAVDRIMAFAKSQGPHLVVTPNVDHIVRLQSDDEFSRVYAEAALRLADGAPIVLMSRLTGRSLAARVTGADLLPAVCRRAAECGLSVFVLGGAPDVLLKGMAQLAKSSPGLRIQGYSPELGFEQNPIRSAEVAGHVRESGADIVFCCLGSPKGEKWSASTLYEVGAGVTLSVGAAIDFAAGARQRAPVIMQRLCLEWLYRLLQEPRRLAHRYLVQDRLFIRLAAREVLISLKRNGARGTIGAQAHV
jgi:exopolysaccharide biosynthesis WecB/TagA/CpsF family protein